MLDMIITVDKGWLLGVVEDNREKHREIFLTALEGYRAAALETLEKQVKDLQNGRTPEIRITLARPSDHTRDYDRIIGMLKAHKGSEFDIDEDTYAQYVTDDWGWKRQWVLSNSGYAGEKMSQERSYAAYMAE